MVVSANSCLFIGFVHGNVCVCVCVCVYYMCIHAEVRGILLYFYMRKH